MLKERKSKSWQKPYKAQIYFILSLQLIHTIRKGYNHMDFLYIFSMKDTAKREVFNLFLLSRTILLGTELNLKLISVSSPYYFTFYCSFALFKNLSGTKEDILETRKSTLLLWQSRAYALAVGFFQLF